MKEMEIEYLDVEVRISTYTSRHTGTFSLIFHNI